MTDPKKRKLGSFPKHHQKALEEMYKNAGVGRTAKQRHAYWNHIQPNTYISHIELDDDFLRTRCFEMCWLTETFPQDFTFC